MGRRVRVAGGKEALHVVDIRVSTDETGPAFVQAGGGVAAGAPGIVAGAGTDGVVVPTRAEAACT